MVSLIAPVVVSLVFLIVFRSAFALVLGVLGPVMALSNWWETKRNSSRGYQAALEAYQRDYEAWSAVEKRHAEAQTKHLFARFPAPTEWSLHPMWRPVTIDGVPHIRVGQTFAETEGSGVYSGVPQVIDARGGIAVVGVGEEAKKVWRAIALGLYAFDREALPAPHSSGLNGQEGPPAQVILPTKTALRGIFVASPGKVPHDVNTVIQVHHAYSATVSVDGVFLDSTIRPDSVSPQQFTSICESLRVAGAEASPAPAAPDPHDRQHLVAFLNTTEWLDLVAHGPHTIVWGQTGSGKTALITTLIGSLATRYTPEQFQCVVIDFKGGLSLGRLSELPHLVGSLTDLDPHLSVRVIEGILAELRRRERLLADAGVSDIGQLPPTVACARTLIVIDEVSTLLMIVPEWASVLADLAARGRALGLHLIVSGQRVIGQIPHAVVANAPLRACLRVTAAHEATDFLPGVPSSVIESLVHKPVGTALISGVEGGYRIATVDPKMPLKPRTGVGRLLWQPVLPTVIGEDHSLIDVPDALAVVDYPSEQIQQTLTLNQLPSGLCWLVGDSQKGHTSFIRRALESAGHDSSQLIPETAALAFHWLLVSLRLARLDPLGLPRLIVCDRVDRLLRDLDHEAVSWFIDSLVTLGEILGEREPGGHLLVTTLGRGDVVSALSRKASPQLALSLSRRDDWLHWGLPSSLWQQHTPPGRGIFKGASGQVVFSDAERAEKKGEFSPVEPVIAEVHQGTLICPRQPPQNLAPGINVMLRGEVDTHWSAIGRAHLEGTLLISGYSSASFRSQLRFGAPFPEAPDSHAWRVGVNECELVLIADGGRGHEA